MITSTFYIGFPSCLFSLSFSFHYTFFYCAITFHIAEYKLYWPYNPVAFFKKKLENLKELQPLLDKAYEVVQCFSRNVNQSRLRSKQISYNCLLETILSKKSLSVLQKIPTINLYILKCFVYMQWITENEKDSDMIFKLFYMKLRVISNYKT